MTGQSKNPGNSNRRSMFLIGLSIAILSGFSILVSVGAPGAGWLLSVFALLIASALAPFLGARWITISIAISLTHLFTFGPLANFQIQPGVSPAFALLTIVMPLIIATVVTWNLARRGR